jgi:hypothetical protein
LKWLAVKGGTTVLKVGESKFASGASKKIFFDPPTFGACGGYKKISWHFTLQSKICILERTFKKFMFSINEYSMPVVLSSTKNMLHFRGASLSRT